VSNPTRIFYIARHGETDWNRQGRWQGQTDIPLNDAGREQARSLGQRLGALGITHVHSSDLSRARETGEIVAGELGTRFSGAHPGLRERNFGILEGVSREEMVVRFPALWHAYHTEGRMMPEGAEPHAQVIERMHNTSLALVADLGTTETAVLISHGGAIRVWLSHHTERAIPPLGNAAVFRVVLSNNRVVSAEPL
jgi:broad specificity phosphatase PhoE